MSRDERDDEQDEDRLEDERRRPREDDEDEAPRRRRRSQHDRGVVLFADRGGSIIRTGDEALDEDMPVLNAFRQFLDQERRRARRQMIGLIALFTVLLLALAGGGAWYVRTLLRRMGDDIENSKIRLAEEQLSTVSNLQTVARTAVSLKKDVMDTRKASVVLQEKVQAQSGELNKLLDTITTLEIQNSTLQRSMRLLDAKREKPAYRPDLEPVAAPEPVIPVPEPRFVAPQPLIEPQPLPEPAKPLPPPENPVETRPAPAYTPGGIPFRLSLPSEKQ
jgi:hypothetical protein